MADTVQRRFAKSTDFDCQMSVAMPRKGPMSWSLFDSRGQRKYLTAAERSACIQAARGLAAKERTFCLTMLLTSARISEVLALTPARIDRGVSAIVFETLKRRERGIFRAVPIPGWLLRDLELVHTLSSYDQARRLWTWSRTTAWKRVKSMMLRANISSSLAKPRALRHAFGVDATQKRISLSVVRK